MPLQDLSPELRTRLSRVERTVAWFVILATVLLVGGFGYYIYATAKTRGWFVTKINYATSLNDASGLTPGDPVKLMGFNVGELTQVEADRPEKVLGVTVFFNIRNPYYGYIWYDSVVKVESDFLGHRYLEVVKGRTGAPTVFQDKASGDLLVLIRARAWQKYKDMVKEVADTNGVANPKTLMDVTNKLMALLKTDTSIYYTNAVKAGYTSKVDLTREGDLRNYGYIPPLEAPSLSDRLDAVANQVQSALPNILNLTNQLASILSNANNAVSRLDATLADAHPIVTNLAIVTGNLREPNGSLGNWLIPTNLAAQLHTTLDSATATLNSAHATLDTTDTNLAAVATDLDHTLQHLSDLTSNLSWQVQMNPNLVGEISTTIIHTDGLIQGLKRHWLLRSAFKKKTEKKVKSPETPPAR